MKNLIFLAFLWVSPNLVFGQHVFAIQKSRETLKTMIAEEGIVGLSISVSIQDSLVWSEGFGHSDLNGQTPINPGETLFRIASISKPFTGTLLARMYEEDIVALDASLYDYVPDFPKKKYDFTLRQLAMHRAGIRHYRGSEKENTEPLSLEQGLRFFEKSKLRFEPGTEYGYSSYGYNLLGLALQKAAKKPFETLLADYVTQPLGLKNTLPDTGQYENLTTSGFFNSNGKGKIKEAEYVNLFMKMPCGGLLSTSEDLVQFGNAYAQGTFLKAETQQLVLEDPPLPSGKTTGYGMGWGVSKDKKGRTFWSHTGGNTGSVCRLVVYPEQKMTIAIVSNTFGIDYLKFIRNVFQISNTFLDASPTE
ncbi:MAG: serine hydrolase domain-containing protein [Bacteroidota bacterium]